MGMMMLHRQARQMIMLHGPSGRLIVGMHIVCYNRWGHLEHVFEALDTYSEIEVIVVIAQIAPVLAQKGFISFGEAKGVL